MRYDFSGKVALVTGGASGIGRSVAVKLGQEGALVGVADLKEESAQPVVDEITAAGGNALAIGGDVSDPKNVEAAVDKIVNEFGALHLALNNAGIGGPQGPLEDMDIDAYHQLMGVNLHSVFYGMKYQVPHMLAAGGGSIVNTSSILGLVGTDLVLPYVTAKHGVSGMTKAAAIRYSKDGIRINSVHPGYIDTPILEGVPQEQYDGLVSLHPIGRLGQADEVADLVVYLLSNQASFITGSQHAVDGGYLSQ